MLHKWKFILTNWINCYFNEGSKKEQCVNLESLLTIISHLRENLALDESKSSKLEAHTVEEFVREKYPQFKFEHGTAEANNGEDVYIVASLLLFFICVNSKDVDIKNAMCSKLSFEDQETIMKFSKCLMECPSISYNDVQAAITEACGQDIAAGESVTGPPMVAETPPALRSLHGEVRRLQAALDAERFDRNYLQEELARTNLKLEKLLKDKEQYKLDILNLKAKISTCCGQDAEVRGGDAGSENNSRLTRQLEDLEERLVATQGQLDDVLMERDAYKTKVEELKQERDKWVSVSQVEASRAGQLANELETERSHVQSLRDLVTELRQHNLKNCLDGSQLECDDPDASIHSLHNASVCSEACANVIEVQLGEERAKIVVLKQQIQGLQDQLGDLNQRAENETQSLQSIITEKDNDIFNLKHRINEEIEGNNNLKAYFSDEISKLNNDINELEQKLKDNSDSSRQVIEQKMQEIQTLQEEKLSLLQSLSDETTKLESIIKDLRTDVDTEKKLKLKIKEDYENHMMKLNEKVLNRNNELVELQNNIFEKSELIEQFRQDLKREKESKEELSNKCNDTITRINERNKAVESDFQQKCEEVNELQKQFQQNISQLNKEINDLKTINSDLFEKCRILEETKTSLVNDLKHRAYEIEEIKKEMENVHQLFTQEKEELEQNLNEKQAIIDTLKTQLHDEIQYKSSLQNELEILQNARINLSEEVNKLNIELKTLKTEVVEKNKAIYALDLYLKEEKHLNKNLKRDCDAMNEQLKRISEEITKKEDEIKAANFKHESDRKCFQEKLLTKEGSLESINSQLSSEIAEKNALETAINTLKEEKDKLAEDLNKKCNEILQLKEDYEKSSEIANKNNMIIETLEQKLEVETKKYSELQINLEKQTFQLMDIIKESQNAISETNTEKKKAIEEKELQINTLERELDSLTDENTSLKAMQEVIVNDKEILIVEKETLIQSLDEEKAARDVLQNEKNEVLTKIKHLNENFIENQEELDATRVELKHLKTDCKNYEEVIENISSVLNIGLEKLLQNIENEDILNKELKKFLTVGKTANLPVNEQCDILIKLAGAVTTELSLRKNLEMALNNEKQALNEMTEMIKEKDVQVLELQAEVKNLQQVVDECKEELSKQTKSYNNLSESKVRDIQQLQCENESLNNELIDVKIKLEQKVHSLKEKLVDNEVLTDKLKNTYECQIDNLNVMITKLTSYLKDKTVELDGLKKEKELLQQNIEDNNATIKSLQEEVKSQKLNQDKLIADFESERLVLKNMVTVTESVMEDQKDSLNNVITEHLKVNEKLHEEIQSLQELVEVERKNAELKLNEKDTAFENVFKVLTTLRNEKEIVEKEAVLQKQLFEKEIAALKDEINEKVTCVETVQSQNRDLINEKLELEKEIHTLNEEINMKSSCIEMLNAQNLDLTDDLNKLRKDMASLEEKDNELKIKKDSLEFELLTEIDNLTKSLKSEIEKSDKFKSTLHERLQSRLEIHEKVKVLTEEIIGLVKEKNLYLLKLDELKTKLESNEHKITEEITKLKTENINLLDVLNENQTVITNQEQLIKHEMKQNEILREEAAAEKLKLENKCSLLQEYQTKAEKQLNDNKTEILLQKDNFEQLTEEIKSLKIKLICHEQKLKDKEIIMSKMTDETDALNIALVNEKDKCIKYRKKMESKAATRDEIVIKLKQENMYLLTMVAENRAELENIQKICEDTAVEKLNIESKCSLLREDIQALETKLLTNEHKLKEKEVVVSKVTDENNLLSKAIVEEKEISEKYKNDMQSKAAKQLDKKNSEILSLKGTIEQLIEEIESLKTKLTSNENDLKEKDVVMSKMTEENKALVDEKETSVNYQKDLETNYEKQLKENRTEISSLKNNIEQLNEEIKSLTAKLSNNEHDLEEKEHILSKMTEENKVLAEEKEMSKKYQKDLESKAEKQLEENSSEISLLKNNIEQYTEDIGSLKNKLITYELNLKEKDSIMSIMTEENNTLNKALVEEKEIHEKYQKELQSKTENQLDENNSEILSLKGTIEQLTEEIESLKSKLTCYENDLIEKEVVMSKMTEEIKAFVDEKETSVNYQKDLETNYEKQLKENQTEISSLKNNIEQLNEEIKSLTAKLRNSEHDFEEKEYILSKMTEENKVLAEEKEMSKKYQKELESKAEKQLEENSSQISLLKNNIEQYTEDIDSLKNKLITYELNMKEKDSIMSIMTEENNTLNKALVEEKEIHETYQKELQSKAENQLDENNSEILSLKGTIEQLTEEIESLKTKLTSNENDLKEKEVVMSKMTEEIKAFVDEKETSVNYQKDLETNYEKQLKENQTEISSLKNNIEQLNEEIKSLTAKLRNSEHDLEEKEHILSKMTEENKVLAEEKEMSKKYQKELESKADKQLEENNSEISTLKNNIVQHIEDIDSLKNELISYEVDLKEKELIMSKMTEENNTLSKALVDEREISEKYQKELELKAEKLLEEYKSEITLKNNIEQITEEIDSLKNKLISYEHELKEKEVIMFKITEENKALVEEKETIVKHQNELESKTDKQLQENNSEILSLKNNIEQLNEKIESLNTKLVDHERVLKEKDCMLSKLTEENKVLLLNKETSENCQKVLESKAVAMNEEITKLKQENVDLLNVVKDNQTVITNQEHELKQNEKLRVDTSADKLNLENKCSFLQEYQTKAEKQLEDNKTEILSLNVSIEKLSEEIGSLKTKLISYEHDLKEKDVTISKMLEENDELVKALVGEKEISEKYRKELESKASVVYELRQKLEEVKKQAEVLEVMRRENDDMIFAVGQRETFASQEKSSSHKYFGQTERDQHERQQVSSPTSDLTHSSMESFKTISDLEKIIYDKNRTITTLQSDISYLKSLIAESENKLLDVNKEHEFSKENCQQLSSQLKKIVHQKNEEIADLKKQLTKMCVTENRASQIIKVSAKYQAIILKRIAEIKSNTILKELTNFGNNANCDNELKRSLNSAITMEDLENFLETTDRHLKRCSEKQVALQKERDRLTEVNRINESEIINLKKFLTELSVSFKTFSSVKELYAQKLTRVVSVQRTVRREILNLEGRITDTMMCKLERGYAAVMQDLSECAMNLERWVERCMGRTISSEKIKQAFSSDSDRTSLASITFQNTSLEVQLEELENSFQKLLEEVVRAQKGEGAKDAQAVTVMEVRAEYEDKLNRMKAKMKQLYQEQIAVFKEKQKEEVAALERELIKAKEKLAASSRQYEEHIRSLTTELWSVGEKFLMKKDEAEWLRRKQRSGSLMSLQHVHSSGLAPPPEEPSRPSDTHSLRSLPVRPNKNNHEKREGRGLHMSDEEGEVFDNRCLKELERTPRRESLAPGLRLSELRWRNSLCPPHLKSSYPAETQFAATLDEEDIKCVAAANGGRQQRKEVGITAYKKPGPPTPSKQAGRLSATGSELRESLRVEADPQPSRKTSTPSRIRALFRSSRNDTTEGTPRSRLSNIFRKK